MSSLSRALVAALTAVCLLAVTGCGDSDTASNNKYVEAVNKAQTDFAANIGKVQTTGREPKQIFADLETGIDQIVTDLEAVEPPEDVADLHDELIGHFERFKTSISETGDAIESGSNKKIVEAQQKFGSEMGTIGQDVDKTITKINAELQK
jgi:hypothetical protein